MNERTILRPVSFNEYLDNSSGRKFKDLNEQIASRFTSLGFSYSESDTNVFQDRYFRVCDSDVFEREFFPDIKNYIKQAKLAFSLRVADKKKDKFEFMNNDSLIIKSYNKPGKDWEDIA